MLKLIYNILKKTLRICLIIIASLTLILFTWFLIVAIFLGSVYVVLPNGFILAPTKSDIMNISLLDHNRELAIEAHIEAINWHGDYVYGNRRTSYTSKNSLHQSFICGKNTECEVFCGQDYYTKLEELELPYNDIPKQYTYDELLDEGYETYKCFFCN